MNQTHLVRQVAIILAALLVLQGLAPAGVAQAEPAATTFVVTLLGDEPDQSIGNGTCAIAGGGCTLRAAIQEANALAGDDTITFSPALALPMTFIITRVGIDDTALNGDLDIASNVTIQGRGAGLTIIDGNRTLTGDRVFHILVGGTLTLSGLTIQNGGGDHGGGIKLFTTGVLTLTNTTVTNNVVSGRGGGIENFGTVTINNSTISNNVSATGGGLYNGFIGTLSITNSSVRSNTAYTGGGIYNENNLKLTGSLVGNNTANRFVAGGAGNGGGILNNAGSVLARNSTLSENRADSDGGAIYNWGQVSLYSVTIADNRASNDGNNLGRGAGVFTVTSATSNVINTLIAGNSLPITHIDDDCYGQLTSSGGLRIGRVGDCAISGIYGLVDPNSVAGLADNGGPTLTNALLPGSAAINAALYPSGCVDWDGNQLPGDQRGKPRYTGAWCDVGAFENQATPRVWVPLVMH